MAVALTKYRAWGDRPAGPQPARGLQYVELRFTAAATDVDLDLGDFDGTFWGAVDATDLGAKALEHITLVEAQVIGFAGIWSKQLADRVQTAAAGSNGEYAIAFTDSDVPNVTVNAADGETAWHILMAFQLNDGIEPLNISLG